MHPSKLYLSGYKIEWNFIIDEAPRLVVQYAGRKYLYDAIHVGSDDDYSDIIGESPKHDGGIVVWRNSSPGSNCIITERFAEPMVPRNPDTNELGSALVQCLDSYVKGTLVTSRLVGSFSQLIPARIGHNAALDDAVSGLCAVYHYPNGLGRSVYRTYAVSILVTPLSKRCSPSIGIRDLMCINVTAAV